VLKNVESLALDFSFGEGGLMTDYQFSRSIDSDTYNLIKLVRDNKETKKRDVYIAQDSNSIARWGRLQLYEKVDEDSNAARINERLNQLLLLKNREQKTLRLEEIGNIRVRAGCLVPLFIEALGLKQYMLVSECAHKFDGDNHTMSLEVKVY
jgi:hypothetical protein